MKFTMKQPHSPAERLPDQIWSTDVMNHLRPHEQSLRALGIEGKDPYAPASQWFSPQSRQEFLNLAAKQQMLQSVAENPALRGLQDLLSGKQDHVYRSNMLPQAFTTLWPQAQTLQKGNTSNERSKFLGRFDPDARDSLLQTFGGPDDPMYRVNVPAIRNHLATLDPSRGGPSITSNEQAAGLAAEQRFLQEALAASPRDTATDFLLNPPKTESEATEKMVSMMKGLAIGGSSIFLALSLLSSKGNIDFPVMLWGSLTAASTALYKKGNPVNDFLTSTTYEKMHHLFPQSVEHIVEQLQGPKIRELASDLQKNPTEEVKHIFLEQLSQHQLIDSGTAANLQQLTPGELGYLISRVQKFKTSAQKPEFQSAIANRVSPDFVKSLRVS